MATNWLKTPMEDADAESALRKLGHESFRPGQEELIEATMAGRDVLGVLSTGFGKSACFQVPGLLQREGSPTLIVSPLIALMRDQAGELKERGVNALTLHYHQTPGLQAQNLRLIQAGRVAFVYVSPERLANPQFREATASVPFGNIALDEAHCVSMWGHSFRPDYLGVQAYADTRPEMRRSAFTATASPMVRADIIKEFGLRDPFVHMGNPVRPNLTYGVNVVEGPSLAARIREKDRLLLPIVREAQERGRVLVYCSTVKGVEELRERLLAQGITAGFYHGQMEKGPRKEAEESFKDGRIKVMVATNAFGMGVNLPDIRSVVHFDTPTTLMNYAQETGRSGRDGEPSSCNLLYTGEDLAFQRELIEGAPDADYVKKLRVNLLVYHNGGPEKAGKPFSINWGNLYTQMRRNSFNKASVNRFNVAFSILKQYGLLEQRDDDTFILKPVDPQGPEMQTMAARLDMDRRTKLFGLDQMQRYATAKEPSQEMLYRLMDEDATR